MPKKRVMDEATWQGIHKIFIDAVLKAQKDIEGKYKIKTRIDFEWEAVDTDLKEGYHYNQPAG